MISTLRFDFGDGCFADVELLWNAAPKTCTAICKQLKIDGEDLTVMAAHGRHSGAECLFITPQVVRDVGEENASKDFKQGDVLFCYEPKGICEHADEDLSEVAWLYHDACQPRRWVSVSGDPTNKRGPFKTVDVAMNKWGRIVNQEGGFYEKCSKMTRLGEQKLRVFQLKK